MKSVRLFILLSSFLFSCNVLFAQNKQTYEINGTKYIRGENYKTTGNPKVDRSSSAKSEFLKSRGYDKTPTGYQVDHIIPLSKGGADKAYNMQLIPTDQHKVKTANERKNSSIDFGFSTPKYKSPSYLNNHSTYSYPSNTSSSSKTIYTGSKGGQYYINKNGNKTYTKRK